MSSSDLEVDAEGVLEPGAGRALGALRIRPEEIEERSMARLAALGGPLPPPPADAVALRMAYAAADAALLEDIVVGPALAPASAAALQAGAPVVCDVAMVAAGVRGAASRFRGEVLCAVDHASDPLPQGLDRRTVEAAGRTTRTARGLLALGGTLGGAVVIVGTSPTALLALLDVVGDGMPQPASVIATPCGHVAAAEAKHLAALAFTELGIPLATVRGVRGGSAVAAAAFNACARLAGTAAAGGAAV